MTKIAIITGATGNLGKAVTAKMVYAGFQVVATVMPGKADTVLVDTGIVYKELDLMNASGVDSLISEVYSNYGNINAVICLVGGFDMASITETAIEDLQRMIDLNFYTAFNTVKPVLEIAKDQGEMVKIVFISAKPAFNLGAASKVFPYALSKSMIVKMAELINADSKNLNASAAIIVPSIIDTLSNRKAIPNADFTEWVTPQSIADKIAFICSDEGKDLRECVFKIYGRS